MKTKKYRKILSVILMAVLVVEAFLIKEEYQKEKIRETEVSTSTLSSELIIPGGMPVGIYMETDGVMILGTEAIKGIDGLNYEPAYNLVKQGDYIVGLNDVTINNKKELVSAVSAIKGDDIVLHVKREEEYIDIRFQPVQTETKSYRLGIWVRDNTQGLGTVTFLTSKSQYGALGHGIHDTDTSDLLTISKGALYETSIKDIKKGSNGNPGGMEGIIVYNDYNLVGDITQNTESGIYGTIDKVDSLFAEQEPMEVGKKESIEKGEATIRCSVDGTVRDYEIRITKIDLSPREINKGIVIEVTDPTLLELTGGIVQGMSGSPIIQNEKIIGAVTHVFVQDSAKGYGIFIENMLENVK